MLHYSMLIQWSDTDNEYTVTIPELPGCKAHGDTYEEAARNGRELLEQLGDAMLVTVATNPDENDFYRSLMRHVTDDILMGNGYLAFCREWLGAHGNFEGCYLAWKAKQKPVEGNSQAKELLKEIEEEVRMAENLSRSFTKGDDEILPKPDVTEHKDEDDISEEPDEEFRQGYEDGLRKEAEIKKMLASKRYQGYKAAIEEERKKRLKEARD